jgi:hypothetical protein
VHQNIEQASPESTKSLKRKQKRKQYCLQMQNLPAFVTTKWKSSRLRLSSKTNLTTVDIESVVVD